MREEMCDTNNCTNMVEVEDDYEPKSCCNGFECGCMGLQINPVFCEDCEAAIITQGAD